MREDLRSIRPRQSRLRRCHSPGRGKDRVGFVFPKAARLRLCLPDAGELGSFLPGISRPDAARDSRESYPYRPGNLECRSCWCPAPWVRFDDRIEHGEIAGSWAGPIPAGHRARGWPHLASRERTNDLGRATRRSQARFGVGLGEVFEEASPKLVRLTSRRKPE